MTMTIAQQLAALAVMTPAQLRARYAEVFGEEARSGNKDWLRKRIAWRLQALAEGGLSERGIRRANELANDADLRGCVPRGHSILGLVTPAPRANDTREDEAGPVVAGSTTALIGPRLHRPQDQTQVPAPQPALVRQPRDERLPPVGTVLTRRYKGQVLLVTVLADGFEYAGEKYPSLSAVAKAITGSHCNGFAFFKVGTATVKKGAVK
jgi:hypothetical protein